MQTAYHPQGSTKWGFTAGFTGRQAEDHEEVAPEVEFDVIVRAMVSPTARPTEWVQAAIEYIDLLAFRHSGRTKSLRVKSRGWRGRRSTPSRLDNA